VAYGPEAIVLVLAAAGTSALRLTLPVTLAIAGLLVVLAAASLVVDYVLTVAVSLAAGAARLASAFPRCSIACSRYEIRERLHARLAEASRTSPPAPGPDRSDGG
jgi:hypothetical protein